MADDQDYAHTAPSQPNAYGPAIVQGPGIMYLGDPEAAERKARAAVDETKDQPQSMQTRKTLFGKASPGASDDMIQQASRRAAAAANELQEIQTYRKRTGR